VSSDAGERPSFSIAYCAAVVLPPGRCASVWRARSVAASAAAAASALRSASSCASETKVDRDTQMNSCWGGCVAACRCRRRIEVGLLLQERFRAEGGASPQEM